MTKADIKEIIRQYAAIHGVPNNLAQAVARKETGFNPNLTSKVGAQGLFQLMPQTQKSYKVTDPFDPGQSANAGLRFLANLKRKFGTWDKALAAYNWGPGNLTKNKGKIPASVMRKYVTPILTWAGEIKEEKDTEYSIAGAIAALGTALYILKKLAEKGKL